MRRCHGYAGQADSLSEIGGVIKYELAEHAKGELAMLPKYAQETDDQELKDRLKALSNTPMTPEERREQIVSFVFSGRGKHDQRTREEIKKSLEEQGLI